MTKSEFFDRVALSDDPLLFTNAEHSKIKRLKQRLGNLTGQRILEPGCGVGPLTEYLSKWVGPKGHVLAFDASCGMVAQCRARVGHLNNVQIVQASAESIELQPAAWDLIILFRVFPHFDDKATILRRLHLCLTPGGRLVIANLEGSARLTGLHATFSEAVRHDRMPCLRGTTHLLELNSFQVTHALDFDEEFFIEAQSVNTPCR